MRYAQYRKNDIANGQGIRVTLFVSGCTHNCPNCFNKDYQDFKYGTEWNKEIEDTLIEYLKDPYVDGLSVLGGEPLQQTMDDDMYNFLKRVKTETNKSIWLWTGYILEDLLEEHNTKVIRLLSYIDVLIDGPFIEDLKDLNLIYSGSSNQRVIDMRKTEQIEKIITLPNRL